MPVSAQRNMMNASSNYQIITAIVEAIRTKKTKKLFIPGAFGNLGGYPVLVGYREGNIDAWIDESVFDMREMDKANQASMYLDGIEKIRDGSLYYTDELIQKVEKEFGVDMPKSVNIKDIEEITQFIINKIIIPNTKGEHCKA